MSVNVVDKAVPLCFRKNPAVLKNGHDGFLVLGGTEQDKGSARRNRGYGFFKNQPIPYLDYYDAGSDSWTRLETTINGLT